MKLTVQIKDDQPDGRWVLTYFLHNFLFATPGDTEVRTSRFVSDKGEPDTLQVEIVFDQGYVETDDMESAITRLQSTSNTWTFVKREPDVYRMGSSSLLPES